MKTAKVSKPAGTTGGSSGTAASKPVKSWSKVASTSSNKPQTPETTRETDSDGQSREKMLQVLSSLQNTEAEVTVKSGVKYRGLVKSVDVSGDLNLVLKGAKILSSNASNGSNGTTSDIKIQGNDLVEVFAAKLSLASSSDTNSSPQKTAAWKTDTDISGKGQVRERVLQAWQPPPDEEGFGIEDEISSQRPTSSTGKKWDQFAVNEKLFGVKSEWDEDVYTHKLDTSRPDFAKRQAEAERIAREIESSASSNPHVLEERGVADDSGMTEEDKYSGVHRSTNAWQPPARRPIANLPMPRTAQPVDPAIISSQLAKPGATPTHRVAQSVATALSVEPQGKNGGSGTTKKPIHPVEGDIMARFRQFASNERDRLSVRKAANVDKEKRDKEDRIQGLLAFSKDFKLNTPVPEDLIPILTKDKAKQEAIVQKAASSIASTPQKTSSSTARAVEQRLPETLRSRVDAAHESKSPDVSASPLLNAKPQTPELKKLKPSATEFKPFNPAASTFTPSFGQRAPQAASPALSTASSQPRQAQFSADAATFFSKKPKPFSDRAPILSQFDPFKTFRSKNPDSSLDIETPLKVDPSWPGEQSQSIQDPPQDERRPQQMEEQYPASQMPYAQMPAMMFVGSPQQAQGFQPQPFYGNKGSQYMSMPPGQFVPYQAGPGFVPPQYMFQGAQAYGPRGLQPHMVPVQYSPQQQFNGYNPQMGSPIPTAGFSNHNQGSPRPRQNMAHANQRSPEMPKSAPRPPPMSAEPSKEP